MSSVERGAALSALLVSAASWLLAPSLLFSLGVTLGALLTLADFVLLRMTVARFLVRRDARVGPWIVLLLGKWGVLALLLFVSVRVLALDALGLIVGVSSIVFAFVMLPALLGLGGDAHASSDVDGQQASAPPP